MAVFARLAEGAGVPPTRLLADFAALSLGPGRVSLSDYEALRLWEEAFWGEADRRGVVGAKRARDLALKANFRHDWLGFLGNRLAWGGYLAAHGLPSVPTLAIYRAGLAAPGAQLLRTRDELRQFLTDNAARPLVARPAEGGSARMLFAESGGDPAVEIDRLVDDAGEVAGVPWLIQPRLEPHPAVAGGRLAAVRLITLSGERGAMVFRAYWRLGGREDVIARLDLKTGRALCLARAEAPDLVGRAPSRLAVPGWPALKAAATEGARLLGEFGLLGWDIAPTADGPVILNVTPTPELTTTQLLERQGALTPEFSAFLAERRTLAAEWAAHQRTVTAL